MNEKISKIEIEDVLKSAMNNFEKTGNLQEDVVNFFKLHNCLDVIEHVNGVAKEAKSLVARFSEKEASAFQAGLLHDISVIFPDKSREKVAVELGIDVLPEEKAYPAILHQKISKVMASQIFGISDKNVLSAISCHTTLKKGASNLDKVVFIADKLNWDEKHSAPYRDKVIEGLERSLDKACFCYLDYLWNQNLKVVHPWLKDAYKQLKESSSQPQK